jgi:hypothetical protein
MAVFAPMPSASDNTAKMVTARCVAMVRSA